MRHAVDHQGDGEDQADDQQALLPVDFGGAGFGFDIVD